MKISLSRFVVPGMAFVAFSCICTVAVAQTTPSNATPAQGTQSTQDNGGVTKTAPVAEKPDPLKRRLSDREERERLKATRIELKGQYKKWLDEDVRWIITDQEAKTFKSLSNDEERDSFIEQFWQRRNPNPDSNDNEYRDEYYARIAYANEHFAAGQPGWMTDRGHIYIAYGKPDSIDSHPSGGSYERPMDEGGITAISKASATTLTLSS
jgi:GWxTD domain-containing protein